MALKYTSKTNNKHTCQILAAVVKYTWILLHELEHMHNYAKILIGFQQPSYSRWICTSTGLLMTHRATRSGLPYACCHGMHSSRCPAVLAIRQLPGWWKQPWQESTERTNQVWGRAQPWGCLAVWGRFTWRLWRVLDDPQCHAPQTLQGVQSMGQKCSSLAYAAIKHRNWNVWLWNISIDKLGIKQLKTLKTKPQKLPLKNNHPGHAGFGDLLFFYLTLNLELMKTSRLMVLEYETLCCQENLTGGTRTACLCLISSPAPVLGRPPLQRRTPPWSLWPDCKYDSSFDSAFCSTSSPQKTRLRLFSYFTNIFVIIHQFDE